MSRLMQLRLVAVLSLGAMQLGCNGETIKAPQPGATMHIEAASPTILTGTIGDIRPSTSTRLTHEIPDSPGSSAAIQFVAALPVLAAIDIDRGLVWSYIEAAIAAIAEEGTPNRVSF